MLAYFVVFHKNGFSPSDLRKSQKNGGKLDNHPSCVVVHSPDPRLLQERQPRLYQLQRTIPYRTATSRGTCSSSVYRYVRQCGWASPMTNVVYSILVYLLNPVLQRKWQFWHQFDTRPIGLRRSLLSRQRFVSHSGKA